MLYVNGKMKLFLCIFLSALYKEVMLDSCLQHEICDDCIKDSTPCVWCAMESFNDYRCRSEHRIEDNWCLNHTVNPQSNVHITQGEEFNSDWNKKIIQIKPQKLKINMRRGVPTNFNFYFNAAANYPADLYFLFDGSKSMDTIRYQTAQQTEILYKMLQTFTNNVHLGLGVFIDKNTLPFVMKKNSKLTYSFKHSLRLTNDYNKFKELVNVIEYGVTNDRAEGGMDALAQAIVCRDAIGWRNDSIKIIVYLSDGYFHVAGDGALGGIVDPYDGKCYLQDGRYANELVMDYPSLNIIDKLAYDEQVMIIFASQNLEGMYKMLTKEIRGAQSISYKKNEQGFAEKLWKIYKELTTDIVLKTNMESIYENKIEISFEPNCIGKKHNPKCTIKIGTEINLVGKINILEYLEEEHITVNVTIQGLKEKLTLDLEIIKKCDCMIVQTEDICNGKGIKKCGVCECFQDRSGANCECSTNKDILQDRSNCRAPNATIDCSGYGSCFCGQCSCEDGHKGKYCECDNYSCARDANGICGGPSNGECECGTCKCKNGWIGDSCNCDTSTNQCETGSAICFGYDNCECNKCQCPMLDNWDARSEQDLQCRPLPCKDCHRTQCYKLELCALNFIKHGATQCDGRINITTVESLLINDTDWSTCLNVRGDVGCYTKFVYRYNNEAYGVELIVQSVFDCAQSYYLFGGACLAGLIVIGIATIFGWKWLNDLRDRREYERFIAEYEAHSSEICHNPVFAPATQTFQNPNFGFN